MYGTISLIKPECTEHYGTMPREGYSTVTLPMQVHCRLREAARNEHRSMPRQVEHMLDELYPDPSIEEVVKPRGRSAEDPMLCVNRGASALTGRMAQW
jgi:hypothetical protein